MNKHNYFIVGVKTGVPGLQKAEESFYKVFVFFENHVLCFCQMNMLWDFNCTFSLPSLCKISFYFMSR